jgi:hypothetical protein
LLKKRKQLDGRTSIENGAVVGAICLPVRQSRTVYNSARHKGAMTRNQDNPSKTKWLTNKKQNIKWPSKKQKQKKRYRAIGSRNKNLAHAGHILSVALLFKKISPHLLFV